jgi:hypothetical protein
MRRGLSPILISLALISVIPAALSAGGQGEEPFSELEATRASSQIAIGEAGAIKAKVETALANDAKNRQNALLVKTLANADDFFRIAKDSFLKYGGVAGTYRDVLDYATLGYSIAGIYHRALRKEWQKRRISKEVLTSPEIRMAFEILGRKDESRKAAERFNAQDFIEARRFYQRAYVCLVLLDTADLSYSGQLSVLTKRGYGSKVETFKSRRDSAYRILANSEKQSAFLEPQYLSGAEQCAKEADSLAGYLRTALAAPRPQR